MDPAGPRSHIPTVQSASSFASTASSTPPASPGQSRLSSRVPEAARRARARRDWTPPEWKPALSRREGAFLALFFVLYAVTWVRLFGAELLGRGNTTAVAADGLQRNATLAGLGSAFLAGHALKAICEAGGGDEFGIGAKCASGDEVVFDEAVEGGPVFGSVSEQNMEGVHTCPCNVGVILGALGEAAVGKKCGCGCAETGVCNCKKKEKAAEAEATVQDINEADFATPAMNPPPAEASVSTPSCGCGAKNKLSVLGVPAPAKKCGCGCAETGVCKCGQKTEPVDSSDIASVGESEVASFELDGKASEEASVEAPSCGCGGGGAKSKLSVLDAPLATKKCGCGMKTGACTCNLEADESVSRAGASEATSKKCGCGMKTGACTCNLEADESVLRAGASEATTKKCGCGMKTGACTCSLEADESVSRAGASEATTKKCGCGMKTGTCTCSLEADESVSRAGASEATAKKCGCGMKTGACTCSLEADESVSKAGASEASDAQVAEDVKAETKPKAGAPDSNSVEEVVAPDSTSQCAGKVGACVLGTAAGAKKCACGCAETGVCKCAGGAQSSDAETCWGDAADVETKAIPGGFGARVGAIAQSLKGLFVGKKLDTTDLSTDIDSAVEAADERLAESVDSSVNDPDTHSLVDDSEDKSASVQTKAIPSGLGARVGAIAQSLKGLFVGKKLDTTDLSSDIDSAVEAADERFAESVDSSVNDPDTHSLVDESEDKSASVPSWGSKAVSLFYGAKDRFLGKTAVKSSEVPA